jgi:hypothetical protein
MAAEDEMPPPFPSCWRAQPMRDTPVRPLYCCLLLLLLDTLGLCCTPDPEGLGVRHPSMHHLPEYLQHLSAAQLPALHCQPVKLIKQGTILQDSTKAR